MFAAIGAILFDCKGEVLGFASAELDESLLEKLKLDRKQTAIFE